MRTNGWVLLGGVGLLCLACGGKLNNIGELGAGGTGAAAGSGGQVTAAPGGGGRESEPGEIYAEALSDIRWVTANETTLFWVEYGSFDELDNHRHDGRLLARDLDSDEVRVLSDELPGPIAVNVTTEHALVYAAEEEDYTDLYTLLRLPLAGGPHEVVMTDAAPRQLPQRLGSPKCPYCIVHDGATAYLQSGEDIYRLAAADSEATLFAKVQVYSFAVAGDSLFVLSDSGPWRVPLSGEVPENPPFPTGLHGLAASGDSLSALDGEYVSRMPLSTGVWTHLPPKYEIGHPMQLQINGQMFFHELAHLDKQWSIVQGKLAEPGSAKAVLTLPAWPSGRTWIGTSAGVFWNDGKRLMRVPNARE